MPIDKNNFKPIYLQIKENIKSDILSGKYAEGDKLPSESELVKHYGVTRTTIQRALTVLVNDGLIERVHGKGSFVRIQAVRENVWNFSSFSAHANRTNQIAVSKVITHKKYTVQQVDYLKLVRLRGLKKHNQTQWITLDTSILSLTDFPTLNEFDFTGLSLYETLETKFGSIPSNAQLTIKAIHSNKELMNYFDLTSVTPLLNAKGKVIDQTGKVIEQVDVVYSPKADFNFIANI